MIPTIICVLFAQAPVLLLCLCLTLGEPQNNFRGNNRNNRQNRRPARQNNGQFLRNGVTRNGSRDRRGTEVYPGCDGKVCLPEAQLCAERQNKVNKTQNSQNFRWNFAKFHLQIEFWEPWSTSDKIFLFIQMTFVFSMSSENGHNKTIDTSPGVNCPFANWSAISYQFVPYDVSDHSVIIVVT